MRRNPYFFLLVCLGVEVGARKHHLIIENDVRQSIPLSTFGFYQGGNLHVNLSGFHPTDGNHYDLKELLIGFSIDRTLSDGLNPYMEDPDRECILSRNIQERDTAGIIRFQLNFNTMMTEIRCSKNVQSIAVTKDIAKREDQDNISDQNIFPVHRNGPRRKRNMKDPDIEHFFESPLDKEIAEANSDIDKNKTAGVGNLKGLYAKSELLTEKLEGKADPKLEDSLGLKEKVDTKDDSKDDTQSSENDVEQPVETKSVPSQSSPDDACSNYQIPINLSPSGYQTSFQIFISDPSQEGLYSMFFHNCHQSEMIPVDFDIKMEEKNIGDNYLSAGEMPLPALYQMLSILFLLTGVFWVFILKKNGTEQVFRIHWIMASLVFLKSLSLFFHGVNYMKIASNGYHIETWAVLYYITHLLKGGLLFFTIVLIGSGWAFIKHILSSKEKRIFMIVLPLQVLANVAYIIVEESEEGSKGRNFWKELFILIDLVCCGAILMPVVWSIRHLQDASNTDGKAAMSLEKLKLFRHFYVMVVCYVYFTRIIVYLLRITVPFQYSWLDEMFKEMTTFVFFVMTGYKFRPASNNPYFSLPTEEQMEQILVGGTAVHEQIQSRKSYRIEDMKEDDEETVVLFSKHDDNISLNSD